MRLPLKARHLAPRLITGAFIINSGKGKLEADEAHAQQLHGFATATYPFLGKLDAGTFTRYLAYGEMAVGTALVLPVVPTVIAGALLTGFSAGLVGLYLKTPGMRKEGSLAPTEQGLALAKDSWLLGIGLGFLADAASDRCCRRSEA